MLRSKFASVLLAASMCLSLYAAPVLVFADETEPSATETSEVEELKPSESEETTGATETAPSESTEPSQTDKFTVSRKDSVRTVSGMCGERAVWQLDNTGTLTVSGFGDMDTWESVDLVPWKNYKDNIKNIVISSGVTSVSASAFEGLTNLESVNIAGTVTKIGNYAFSNCSNLKSAVMDENLYKTSSGIFYGCYNVHVSYIPSYPITVYGGISDVNKACAGTIVTLKAYDEASDKVFDQWIVNRGEVELTIVDEKTATFVMPASYVEILASFKDKEPQNNTLAASGRKTSLKEKKLKKKAQKVSRSKVMTVRNAQGRLTFKLLSVSKSRYKKYFKINSRNGNVTVKKKLKKGTYTVKCRVTASGNANFKSGSRVVSFKIKVK
ncbi:MAG: leucine-rich repeat domain-containing protein [Clostridiales bacterium]|nr:leucine-rich repeat domain-containing protein [Clostridiales bacterium]